MPALASYRTKFSDASYDPFNGEYEAIMDTYRVPLQANNAPTPADLAFSACNARSTGTIIPTAFMILQTDHKIHLYHSLSKFLPRLGLQGTNWDNEMFVTKGELYQNQATTTYWLGEYFHQIPGQHRVASPATIDTALGGDPLLESVGPYNDQDAGTQVVRCRRSIYCPPKYVPMMMDPISPREAWRTLRAQIVTDGHEVKCRALIEWLQVAMLATDANNRHSPLEVQHPAAPVADAILLEHRHQILLQDFPHLAQNQHAVQQNQIATQVGHLATVIQQENVAAAQRRQDEKVKSISSLVGDAGVIRLLRWCQKNEATLLPPIWSTLANTTKGQQILAFQFAVDQLKQELNLHDLQFIITPVLFNKLKQLHFIMTSIHALESGIQPFVTGETTEEGAALSVEMWTALTDDKASPAIADLQAMLKSTKQLPKLLIHSRESIRRTTLLLAIALGGDHPVVLNLESFLATFISKESFLITYVPKSQAQHLLPILINKWIAVRLNKWYKDQAKTVAHIPAPIFTDVFDKMEMDEPWEPSLSLALTQSLRQNANPPTMAPTIPPQLPVPPPTATPPTNPPTGGNNNGGGRQRENTSMTNPDFCTEVMGRFADMPNISARTVRRREWESNPWPKSKVRTEEPMCLAYHVKGLCNQNCGRIYDHVCYTAEELQPLKQWCEQHWHA